MAGTQPNTLTQGAIEFTLNVHRDAKPKQHDVAVTKKVVPP